MVDNIRIKRKSQYFINSTLYKTLIENEKIHIVDVGARGTIFKPFNLVDRNLLYVTASEPDNSASLYNVDQNLKAGLWNIDTEKTLYITNHPFCSSLFKPNEAYKNYDFPNFIQRTVNKNETVKVTTLDSMDVQPDFIKIDTQGSEYEILEGAKNTIEKHKPILLLELWVNEAYENTQLLPKVWMMLKSYFLLELRTEYPWYYNNKIVTKGQYMLSDSLFVSKDLTTKKQVLKRIAILDLFLHVSLALQILDETTLLDTDEKAKIKSFLCKHNKSVFAKLWNALLRNLKIFY